MQSTQLACPHCGSSLNFGTAVAAGTPVECLICMQTFAAAPVAVTSAPTAKSEAAPVAPKVGIMVAKPHAPPAATVAPKSPRANPAPSAMPVRRKPNQAEAGGKAVLLSITIGLLFLLTGGISFAIWKITASTHRSGADPQGASTDPDNPPGNADGSILAANGTKPALNDSGAPVGGDEDEDLRRIKELEKKLLTRKASNQAGGADLEWNPGSTFNVPAHNIAGLDQQKINAAIHRGVVHLKATQNANGTWNGGPGVGTAALGGLTLLECGAPPADLNVQRAAFFIRSNSTNLGATYELALAILFLDRLGEARDRPLIRGLAVRLLAGQTDGGGWSYTCPVLTPPEMFQLYAFLQSHQQPNLLNPLQAGIQSDAPPANPAPRKTGNDPFQQLSDTNLKKADGPKDSPPDADKPKKTPLTGKPNLVRPRPQPIMPGFLAPRLQQLAIVKNQGRGKGQIMLVAGGGDNSNTQFALLGLWVARRHEVATDQAFITAHQRFLSTQSPGCGWDYSGTAGTSPAMTGVGLLGLAMGHGAAPDIVRFDPKNPKEAVVKAALDDPAIQKGLKAFARFIGDPSLDSKRTSFPTENLYFLWTVERVAMLYDLHLIDGKDWYGWGAQILVHTQDPQGNWPVSSYPGAASSVNTCFALLFLKRSNLVQDLTNNLRLYSGIRAADGK